MHCRGGVPAWGVYLPGGTCLGGVPAKRLPAQVLSPVNRITDTYKNITLPRTSFAGGKYDGYLWTTTKKTVRGIIASRFPRVVTKDWLTSASSEKCSSSGKLFSLKEKSAHLKLNFLSHCKHFADNLAPLFFICNWLTWTGRPGSMTCILYFSLLFSRSLILWSGNGSSRGRLVSFRGNVVALTRLNPT